MRKISVIIIAAFAFLSCTTGKHNQSPMKENWISLFDGKTLTGWHTYGKKTINAAWGVEDGTIFQNAAKRNRAEKGSGDLVTDGEFENFHLKIDWKIAKNGNSGIIFWLQEDTTLYKQTYHTGPEMQVLDNDGHPDGKIKKHRAGNLYDLVEGKEGAVKPVGEWNTAEIISNKGALDLILNGITVVSTVYGDDNWRKMIAGSKFKEWPDFAKVFKGHIALQDHGNNVWFRNIMIKNL